MSSPSSPPPSAKKLGAIRRKPVSVSQDSLIRTRRLESDRPLPLLVEPGMEGVNLISWTQSNRPWIEGHLRETGGILFRGWNVTSIDAFEEFTRAAAGAELLDYSYRSTPRSAVSGKIYSSTEYPADQTIPQHNEMAYTRTWPLVISFFCVKAAEVGGETPLADSRRVYQRIDPAIRDEFARRRVLYVRNYGGGLDLPWQNVFQTSDRSEVEAFCGRAGIEWEWRDGDRLRTRQVCQAVARHPATGEMVWFNQAHLFHVSSLDPVTRQRFLAEFREEDLPRNTYYGDGAPIELSTLEEIRRAYDRETVAFPWQEGDIMLLDNMLVTHGRRPFQGTRKVVVGMAQPISDEAAEKTRMDS